MLVQVSCILKRIIGYCKADCILYLFQLSRSSNPLFFILIQSVQMSPHCHCTIGFLPICKMLLQKSNLKAVKKSFIFTAQIPFPILKGIKAPYPLPGFCFNLLQWKLLSVFLYQHTSIILSLWKLHCDRIAGFRQASGQPIFIKSGFHFIPDIVLIRCFIVFSRKLFLFQ